MGREKEGEEGRGRERWRLKEGDRGEREREIEREREREGEGVLTSAVVSSLCLRDYETLTGSRGRIESLCLCLKDPKLDLENRINFAVFPSLQGLPHRRVVCA